MATGIFPDLKINSFYCETETVLDAVNWDVSISLSLESRVLASFLFSLSF